MEFVLPTLGEWKHEIKRLVAETGIQISDEEMAHLYPTVSTILCIHIDMPHQIDYDDCFRARGCAVDIFSLDQQKRLAAQAYINVLKKSYHAETRWMGKNIEEELLKIFMTGVVPKTYQELQGEEWEKEHRERKA